MSKILKLEGQKFGRLTAIERTDEKNYKKGWLWKFSCECGKSIVWDSHPVTSGKKTHCGCVDNRHKVGDASRTHGMTGKPEWISWQRAKMRVNAPSSAVFGDYQDKGITMSQEFQDSFEVFFEHIGRMPDDGVKYSLGRIENTGHYERGNIRWEDKYQQARNKGKFASNSSGTTGVFWCNKKNRNGTDAHLYATAHWSLFDQTVKSKNFSVKTYGLLPAFKMACEYREQMIDELNKQGAGYPETHGK